MANEIGFWLGLGTGANGTLFSGSVAGIATSLHTAGSGETITHVRMWRNTGGTSTTVLRIGLFVTSGGTISNGTSASQSVTFSTSSSGGEFGADVSWALTNGVTYALAMSSDDGGIFNGSTAVLTNGARDSNNIVSSTWSDAGTENVVYELAGDITTAGGGGSPFRNGLLTLGIG